MHVIRQQGGSIMGGLMTKGLIKDLVTQFLDLSRGKVV